MESIAVIVVHYGDYVLTRDCLKSILASDTQVRIIVSDNGNYVHKDELSKDFTNCSIVNNKDIITNESSNLVWLVNKENTGYAGAANAGLRLAKKLWQCTYYLILNNDCTLTSNCISSLMHCYKSRSHCGIMGAKVLFANSHSIINSVGGYFNKYTAWQKNIGAHQKDIGQYTGLFKPDYIYGACMFFHSSFLEKVGYMDESFLLYYEEHDWCIRAQKKGFENYTCTEAIVHHRQGASSGKKIKSNAAPDFILILQYSNLIRFYLKHFPMLTPVAYLKLCAQALKRLVRGQLQHAFLILTVIFGKRINRLPS